MRCRNNVVENLAAAGAILKEGLADIAVLLLTVVVFLLSNRTLLR